MNRNINKRGSFFSYFQFNILDRYIGKTILIVITQCLVMLVGLSAIIKYIEQLRFVGRGSYNLTLAFYYVLWQIPKDIEQFLPMATLLGGLIGLGLLASHSELIVMQSSGYSKLKIAFSTLKTAVPLIIAVALIAEYVSPYTELYSKQLRTTATSDGKVLSVRSSIWAKDESSFIYIQTINGDLSISNLTIWEFNEGSQLNMVTTAKTAIYQPENRYWVLQNVTQITTNASQYTKKHLKTLPWRSTLTPDYLTVVSVKPELLPLAGIYKYINYLNDSNQDSSRYKIAFWSKLFQPFSVAVMMLLALSFVFGPLRSVTMGHRVLAGIILGFSFYISNEIFAPLTLVYQLPPILGIILPNLFFTILSIYLLRKKA